MSECIRENPLMGSKANTKIVIELEEGQNGFSSGNIEITYTPDQLVMNSLVLVETVRVLTTEIGQEEKTIQEVGDILVELLKPKSLYVIMKLNYSELQYTVEVNYEFDKTGKYELRRE